MLPVRKISAALCAGLLLLTFAGSADALIILTPSTPGVIAGYGYGPSNCEPDCVGEVFGVATADLSLLYKAEAGFWFADEGTYARSYTTIFYDDWNDPSAALMFADGGPLISCATCFLAIKDGNQTPGYYFYNLSGWNGYESISLRDFWPGPGAISHVAIWGGSSTSVPEPATLGLLGLGVLFAGLARRRKAVA